MQNFSPLASKLRKEFEVMDGRHAKRIWPVLVFLALHSLHSYRIEKLGIINIIPKCCIFLVALPLLMGDGFAHACVILE